jgi:hypothetical protein
VGRFGSPRMIRLSAVPRTAGYRQSIKTTNEFATDQVVRNHNS